MGATRLAPLVLALTLGFAATLVVSVGCALLSSNPILLDEADATLVRRHIDQRDLPPAIVERLDRDGMWCDVGVAPGRTRIGSAGFRTNDLIHVDAVGWPARAFSGSTVYEAGAVRYVDARPVALKARGTRGSRFPLVIPMRPLWRGLAINTLVFAGVVIALRCFVDALRRARRTAMRLCRTCGYDVRGIGAACPECGLAI